MEAPTSAGPPARTQSRAHAARLSFCPARAKGQGLLYRAYGYGISNNAPYSRSAYLIARSRAFGPESHSKSRRWQDLMVALITLRAAVLIGVCCRSWTMGAVLRRAKDLFAQSDLSGKLAS